MIRDLQLLLLDIRVELLVVLAPERELAAEKGEKKHAKRPDIGRRAGVFDLANDLGRHV